MFLRHMQLKHLYLNTLKMLGDKVGEVLCILFKKTINESEITSDWKNANVFCTFIPERQQNERQNHRHISLTSQICKKF